jgi:hypothetical protein
VWSDRATRHRSGRGGQARPGRSRGTQGAGPDVVVTSTIEAIYIFSVLLGWATLGVLIYLGLGLYP